MPRSSSLLMLFVAVLLAAPVAYAQVRFDLSAYKAESGVEVTRQGTQLTAKWPADNGESLSMVLELKAGAPLIAQLTAASQPIVGDVDPVYLLTVGERDLHQAAGWVIFFDDPPKRPHQTFRATRDTHNVHVTSEGHRTTIALDGLSAGNFHGELHFILSPHCRLVQTEAELTTAEDSRAILYDTGLAAATPSWQNISFLDNDDQWHRQRADDLASPQKVRNRTIIAESAGGSLAVFPPPHQYFYPLDFVDNFGFVWSGKGFRDLIDESGFGIRQPLEGDKRHVPWINAPPNTEQHLGIFYLLSSGTAEATLDQVRQFTRGDHFKHLDGYTTFTSHYHIEHTQDFAAAQAKQHTDGIPKGMEEPGFVKAFKSAGVDIAHLAEFHYDTSHDKLSRLDRLKLMHSECRRLSNDQFLLLPGEEPNVHLGGHWISLFPKPVYWTLDRKKDQQFVEQIEGLGNVYHVGSSKDVLHLMDAEHGLMWTAHPRIKLSFGFPDAYKNTDFFRSDRFLGGAWKAMPADDSLPRLGTRVFDLLDDMCNWGLQKYAPGEVDIFKISTESELYGHMNVNYLKLAKAPHFDDGWQPVLDTLRSGSFFVTTGEVLIPACTFNGKSCGETLHFAGEESAMLHANLEWTFPLKFAEVISGDGQKVYRQRIDLTDTDAFGSRALSLMVDLHGRKWVRFEVWDIATNGAFTQPVWIQ